MRRRLPPGKLLAPIHPNIGIQSAFRLKLSKLIREMAGSYLYWLRAQYRVTPPAMAMDAMSSAELQKRLRELGIRWEKRFEEAAPKLAEYFATAIRDRTERRLKEILRDGGISVKFTMTPALRDIMRAEIAQNVSLIRSIPQQYHQQVEGLVMRSVATGRDLAFLTSELKSRYNITDRRARLIAMQQNNAATSAIRRERETAAGIEEGVWLHSHAGKEPRPTHLRNHNNKFNLREGWYDPDPSVRRRIWPGELINCRCTWRAMVKGFT
jgi:uncharacterized protein with gpF-like domain